MFIFLLLGKLLQGHLGRGVIQVHQMFFVNTFSLTFSYIYNSNILKLLSWTVLLYFTGLNSYTV